MCYHHLSNHIVNLPHVSSLVGHFPTTMLSCVSYYQRYVCSTRVLFELVLVTIVMMLFVHIPPYQRTIRTSIQSTDHKIVRFSTDDETDHDIYHDDDAQLYQNQPTENNYNNRSSLMHLTYQIDDDTLLLDPIQPTKHDENYRLVSEDSQLTRHNDEDHLVLGTPASTQRPGENNLAFEPMQPVEYNNDKKRRKRRTKTPKKNAAQISRRWLSYELKPHSWTPPNLPEHLIGVSQTDPELIDHIRTEWLIPPSVLPLDLSHEIEDYSQTDQIHFIDDLLSHRQNGVFAESGAGNGELMSNSLYFELNRNWTGVLIEPNPLYFRQILQKHRQSYKINACLSHADKPQVLNLKSSKFGKRNVQLRYEEYVPTQCFPLYSIVKAARFSQVDFCFLDNEGSELQMLKSFPWLVQDMDIDAFGVKVEEEEEGNDISDFLEIQSYTKVQVPFGLDIVMTKNRVMSNEDMYGK